MDDELLQRQRTQQERTYSILHSYSPLIANELFRSGKNSEIITIQKYVRGFLARAKYRDLLYEQYIKEEEEDREREQKRMEESMLLLDCLNLEKEIQQKQFLARQKQLERSCSATIIQRAWRKRTSMPKGKKS